MSEIKDGENTQENLEQNTEVVENTGPVEEIANPEETQQEKDWKAEYELRDKAYKELQALNGKHTKELGDHRKFRKDFEPYLPYLEQLANQEKQQRYQQDPQLQLREYVESQLAPFREQQLEVQTTKTVQTLQNELGQETYDTLAPIMANVLKYYAEHNPAVAEYLAGDPIALVRQAAGDLFLDGQIKSKKKATELNVKRDVQQKTMAGVAKNGVQGNKASSDMSKMNLQEMKEFLRRNGAITKVD